MRKYTFFIFYFVFTFYICTSCENDDYVTFTQCSEYKTTRKTCRKLDLSEYIDVEHYNIMEMTPDEKRSFQIAYSRLGVYVDENGLSQITATNATSINVSDSLFLFVCNSIEKTNNLLMKIYSTNNRKTFARRIIGNETAPSNPPKVDCVMYTLSHVRNSSKTYEQLIQTADSLYKGWRTKGGLSESQTENLMSMCSLSLHKCLPSLLETLYRDSKDFSEDKFPLILYTAPSSVYVHMVNLTEYINDTTNIIGGVLNQHHVKNIYLP